MVDSEAALVEIADDRGHPLDELELPIDAMPAPTRTQAVDLRVKPPSVALQSCGGMGKARFREAADGYPARIAPTWTETKLLILECYLEAFAGACKSAGGWYGLDLFAGTGLNWSETRGVEIPGSPLIALDAGTPEAIKVIAAEQHPSTFNALHHRVAPHGDRVHAVNEDSNSVVETLLDQVPERAPAFAFLDPEGSELDWGTVEAIAAHKHSDHTKIEQLILLADTAIPRLTVEHPYMVTRMFGHDDWQDTYERRRAGVIDAEQARTEYVRLYARGLTALGYDTVLDRQIERDDGHPMYFLIFASDHAGGRRIMDHCFDQVEVEEPRMDRLFVVKRGPRRTRLGGG